jgi:23S rRNA (adenine2503-C2)-methyltransferase
MREDKKATICVSSQVGCAQKCSFCATGSMGFKRNLTAAEIVGQIVLWKQILSDTDFQSLRVVYMGMGEPFHNLNQVFKSLEVLTDAKALNIGARRITVSTSGVTKGIFRLLEFNPQIQLAISLHTVNEKLRRKWIQGNSASVEQLLDAASQFAEKSGRKVTFEVVVFGGQNFLNTAQINRLARELEGIRCSINLIPFNPHDYCCDTFEAPERDQVLYVQKVLKRWGYEVTVRYSKGKEIQAACGQLVAKTKDS